MTVHTPILDRAARHDGWTPKRKTRFLDSLAEKGNVRHACALVGLSQQAAYVLRRRDTGFARAWAAALALAREHSVQVLADRAIEGVEEEIWYRGELVGTRRKYDTRLLLAHIARLDKLVDEKAAWTDAGRFDELLAVVAGEEVPEPLANERDIVPLDRKSAAIHVGERVSQYYRRQIEDESGHRRESEDAQGEEEYDEDFEDTCMEVYRDAHEQGEALWDQWFEGACERVDAASGRLTEPVAQGLPGGEPLHRDGDALPAGLRDEIAAVAAEVAGRDGGGSFHSWTRSIYSTSALAAALAEPANGIDPTPRSPLDAKARFTPFR